MPQSALLTALGGSIVPQRYCRKKGLNASNKISRNAQESIDHGGYDDLESSADVSSEVESIYGVGRSGLQPRPFHREDGRLH